MGARADLHCHSRTSDRPSEWLLRRIGAPECFTEPLGVYRRCRAAGMDFVTLTDHDSIAGALEIAHLPGAFVSCEVTAAFPEDGCPLHVLVWGIDEARHRAIQELRGDLYALTAYLDTEGIVYALAHPLFRQSPRLTVAHFERLLLLFRRFELVNGSRAPRGGELLRSLLAGLAPELMAQLADRHGLAPRHPQPWIKHVTGGSDDHAGFTLGRAWTETPAASSVGEFLAHLAAGRSQAGGEHGSSLLLARCFTSIAWDYYRRRLAADGAGGQPLAALFERLLAEGDLADLPLGDRIRLFAARRLKRRRTMETVDRALIDELAELASSPAADEPAEQRCFRIASRLADGLGYGALREFGKHLAAGKLSESLQSLSGLTPAAISLAPYVAAVRSQHQDGSFHREIEARFGVEPAPRHQVEVWLADEIAGDGVDDDLRVALAALARGRGRRLERLTCAGAEPGGADGETRFAAVGELRLPELPALALAFPPILELLAACERLAPAAVVVDAPGPLGLVGLGMARLLGVPLVAVYPQGLVRRLSPGGSATLTLLAGRLVRWFYGQARVVYVAGNVAASELAALGLSRSDLRRLPAPRRVAAYAAGAAALPIT